MIEGIDTPLPAPTAPAAAAPAQRPGAPSARNSFNQHSSKALEVYKQAGVYRTQLWGFLPDFDATIKAADIDTNLKAFEAFMGSENPNGRKFVDVIRAHPDLKAGLNALLKDEGQNAVTGLQNILAGQNGQGGLDASKFEEMMKDPVKRDLVAQMLHRVGTKEVGMDYAGRFVTAAMDASQNPGDMGKGQAFLAVAREGGINTTDIERQGQREALASFMDDPSGGIRSFTRRMLKGMETSLGKMPGQSGNMVAGLISGLGGMFAGMMDPNNLKSFFRPFIDFFNHYSPKLAAYGQREMHAAREGASPTPGQTSQVTPAATPDVPIQGRTQVSELVGGQTGVGRVDAKATGIEGQKVAVTAFRSALDRPYEAPTAAPEANGQSPFIPRQAAAAPSIA